MGPHTYDCYDERGFLLGETVHRRRHPYLSTTTTRRPWNSYSYFADEGSSVTDAPSINKSTENNGIDKDGNSSVNSSNVSNASNSSDQNKPKSDFDQPKLTF